MEVVATMPLATILWAATRVHVIKDILETDIHVTVSLLSHV